MRDPWRPLAEVHQGAPLCEPRFHPQLPLVSALDPLRDRGWVWTWDRAGKLIEVACVGRGERTQARWDDWERHADSWTHLAWHPTEALLAWIGVDGSVELRGVDGRSGHDRVPSIASHERASHGAFLPSGNAFWRGGYHEGGLSTVIDLDGNAIATAFGCDTHVVVHPEGELLASFVSDQASTLLRFARTSGSDGLVALDRALILDADGYGGLVFSPTGDRFALMGNAYELFARVHGFPSLRTEHVIPECSWPELRERLTSPWSDFQWSLRDRVAFAPDGASLLFGAQTGHVLELALDGEPSIVAQTRAHADAIGALTVRCSDGLIATTDLHGHLRLFELPHAVASADGKHRPLTAELLAASSIVEPNADQDALRITDGSREWDVADVDEASLADDAPVWARMLATIRQRLSSDE